MENNKTNEELELVTEELNNDTSSDVDNVGSKKEKGSKFLITIVMVLLIALLFRNYGYNISIVSGSSMDDTLNNGDIILVNKFLYTFSKPDREDIVIIDKNGTKYVKRVIGLPGEKIQIINNKLFINGEEYEQDFISKNSVEATGFLEEIKLSEDNYFVMGDNRMFSKDSRNGLGLIKENEIIGRSDVIVYPFEHFGLSK